jgi:hypothetical protein
MRGLQDRIARAINCMARYGTFQKFLHRHLLWQASDVKLKKIEFEFESHVPSWSWMAYNGGIRFRDDEIPYNGVRWVTNLRFDEDREHALVADVGKFHQDCKMRTDGDRYAVVDRSETKRGWIRYDVEDGKNLLEERCVVVGSTKNSEDYYILVARPTSVHGEYERVGIGQVSKNCLVRERVNVRVV